MGKIRLDQAVFNMGCASSRERAKALIMAGVVYVNGEKADKPGMQVLSDISIEVKGNDIPYVSRGGLKLEKALNVFPINIDNKICMDVGASTGGFTDCMLQNGAAKVYSVDVGYGQLAWKLRCDERVRIMERCNFRHMAKDDIEEKIDFFSVDVSFISLKLMLPVMKDLSKNACEAVCLIKPQFEAGKDKVGKKGVVRESATHVDTILMCCKYATDNGFYIQGLDYSPITGPEGNIEFLMYITLDKSNSEITKEIVENVVLNAHKAFN